MCEECAGQGLQGSVEGHGRGAQALVGPGEEEVSDGGVHHALPKKKGERSSL